MLFEWRTCLKPTMEPDIGTGLPVYICCLVTLVLTCIIPREIIWIFFFFLKLKSRSTVSKGLAAPPPPPPPPPPISIELPRLLVTITIPENNDRESTSIYLFHKSSTSKLIFNPFPSKPWFLRVCSTSLLKTLLEKEKLLVTSNFSFSHSVFYLFGQLSAIVIKSKIVVCKLFQFGGV